MKRVFSLMVCLQVLLGIKGAVAETITSWDALRNHANDLNKTYLLEGNITPTGSGTIDVGSSGESGTWYLNGNNILLDGNYGDNGRSGNFAMLYNVDFVFQNMNIEKVKKNNGQGGFLYNQATGQLIDSVFSSTGAQSGGVLYNTASGVMSLIDNNEFKNGFINNGNGAVIANEGKIVKISNSVFDSNGAYDNDSAGGAIYNNGVIDEIDSSDFLNNRAQKNAGAIFNNEKGEITLISANFESNTASVNGGAIYNNGVIGSENEGILSSTFVKNRGEKGGGAIFNDTTGKIAQISAEFTENYSGYNGGGAIINIGEISSVNNSIFSENSADVSNRDGELLDAKGGAIYNKSKTALIDTISDSQFYSNYSEDFGGALANMGIINEINNVTFDGNIASSGGAIDNEGEGTIEKILDSSFYNNTALEHSDFVQGNGGAIRNYNNAKIDLIQGVEFVGNFASGLKDEYKGDSGSVYGGAIYNVSSSTIEMIDSSTFDGNRVQAGNSETYKGSAFGGAIYNGENSAVNTISNTTFENNSASGSEAFGGAVYNTAESENAVSETFENVKFLNNSAVAVNGEAQGGAIYSARDIVIRAEGEGNESVFSGNYVEDEDGQRNEAVYMENSSLELSAIDNGLVRFDDVINGDSYDISITGDGTGEIMLNNNINNVRNLSLAENSIMHLGKNAQINAENYAANNAVLKLDVTVDTENKQVNNGLLNINGDVQGYTNVIVNAETPDVFDGAETTFVSAPNDDWGSVSEFNVARVIGSPYMWDSVSVKTGEEKGTDWKLSLTNVENPDYQNPEDGKDDSDNGDNDNEDNDSGDNNLQKPIKQPVYAPEIAGYVGVQSAVVEQNRHIMDSVARGISSEKSILCYEESCGVAELVARKKAWIDVSNESADIKSPVDIDADIQGVTAGLDLYTDGTHRAGVFGSYRHGKYDLSGKGDYYSFLGSDIKTDSYLGGAYYQFKQDDWRFLGLAFVGKQDLDISTDDHIASASTNAMQYGLSAEASKSVMVRDNLNLEPSLGLRYTMSDIDSLSDNMGKSASFDVVHYWEAELGVKIESVFCNDGRTNRLYVKPSVIQTFVNGNKTRVSGIQEGIKTVDSQTLGRLEAGGEFGLRDNLSGYIRGGYTTGDDYSAYDINLGINYAF